MDNPDAAAENIRSSDSITKRVNTFSTIPESSVDDLEASIEKLKIKKDQLQSSELVYKMDYPQRGLFIVIDNNNFGSSTNVDVRKGTDVDTANLYVTLKEFGFEVHHYQNLLKTEMLELVKAVSKMDHSRSDMFAMAILTGSHGDEWGVHGTDGSIELDSLIAPLKGDQCTTLAGKPKFMIIQASRGNIFMAGVSVADNIEDDASLPTTKYTIPTEADFLYAFSSPPGYKSFRSPTQGSWFVNSLCRVLKEYGDTKEIMWILNRTNHLVAYDFQCRAAKEYMNNKKQIPSIVSQLTKELYFRQKNLN